MGTGVVDYVIIHNPCVTTYTGRSVCHVYNE